MKDAEIISKIRRANLVGRGGACFPTAGKWEMVKKAAGDKKYVVCNASEGEPGVKKDWHIMNEFPGRMVDGLKIALHYLRAAKGYIYLNPDYYVKLKDKLEKVIGTAPIEVFHKPHIAGYAGGEETSALNALENKRIEPRLKPPYPPTNGLWDRPTLVNNVETFYSVSLILRGEYKNKRFYTLNGDILHEGVFLFPETWTIETILRNTDNWPKFDFFVQAGGQASGLVLNEEQLKQPVGGSGSLTVYSAAKHNPLDLIRGWADFFMEQSCGQCTPCREGTYRLHELLNEPEPDWQKFSQVLNVLSETSFCGLGCAAPIAIRTYVRNVLSRQKGSNINLPDEQIKVICECFQ